MDKITQIKLIAEVYTQDDYGQMSKSEVVSISFGNVRSIGGAEFARAGQIGIKPEVVIDIWASEYDGQEIVEYDDKRLKVYRTYEHDGKIELYLEARAGA